MIGHGRRALVAVWLAAVCAPAAHAADVAPPPLPRAWVVVVEGEARTRTLRLTSAQPDGRGGWTAEGHYAFTGARPTPQRVLWQVDADRHRLRFVTGAKSVVEVEGADPDTLDGSFTPVSGARKAVGLRRLVTGSADSPHVDPPQRALPERIELPTFHAGDRWHWEQREPVGGPVTGQIDRIVQSVSDGEVRGTEGKGVFAMTTDLMVTRTPGTWVRGEPRMFSFPMFVGKRWDFAYSFGSKEVDRGHQRYAVEVLGVETVTVPAGTFQALKLRGVGAWFNQRVGAEGSGTFTVWYAPVVKNLVKWGYVDRGTNSMRELVEFQVQP
jgi:hypothetical protein